MEIFFLKFKLSYNFCNYSFSFHNIKLFRKLFKNLMGLFHIKYYILKRKKKEKIILDFWLFSNKTFFFFF